MSPYRDLVKPGDLADAYTPNTAGALMGVSPRTVARWVHSGRITGVLLGGGNRPRIRIPRRSVEAYLAERTVSAAPKRGRMPKPKPRPVVTVYLFAGEPYVHAEDVADVLVDLGDAGLAGRVREAAQVLREEYAAGQRVHHREV